MKKQKDESVNKKELVNEMLREVKLKGYSNSEVSQLMGKNDKYLYVISKRASKTSFKKIKEINEIINRLPAKDGFLDPFKIKTETQEPAIIEILINDEKFYLSKTGFEYKLTKVLNNAKIFKEEASIQIRKNTGKKKTIIDFE